MYGKPYITHVTPRHFQFLQAGKRIFRTLLYGLDSFPWNIIYSIMVYNI